MNSTEQSNSMQLLTLNNGFMDVVLCNYGCTIVSINLPGKDGKKKNVVAGFNNHGQYQGEHPYFGSNVGRYANRIAYGKFKIDETEYVLTTNDKPNHLHGGQNGFNRKLWQYEQNA